MRKIRLARTAKLTVMALPGNLIGTMDHPGSFRRAVLFKLFEELLEARVQLANRAVTVKAQWKITRRGHGLVYANQGVVASALANVPRRVACVARPMLLGKQIFL